MIAASSYYKSAEMNNLWSSLSVLFLVLYIMCISRRKRL